MAHQNLSSDSPLANRIARSFLRFLNSVELSAGADGEALDVAKDCLAEVFGIDRSALGKPLDGDDLIDIFRAREGVTRDKVNKEGLSNAPGVPSGSNGAAVEAKDKSTEPHSPGHDELFGQLFDALEKMDYFRIMADGNDDQYLIDRATRLFHKAVKEMKVAGCQSFDMKNLAETFKSLGNKAMKLSVFGEAIEFYTYAIALCEDNAVYYCNRAAAYTHTHRYDEAIQDCLKSVEINPNYGKAYSRLGFAYYAQGNYKDAIDKGFAKALVLDPNNESVMENIRVSEQKLREEQRRSGPGQSSAWFGRSDHQNGNGSSRNNSTSSLFSSSMELNLDNLTSDIVNLMRNRTGNMHSNEAHDDEHEFGEPGFSFGGNMNANVDDDDFPVEFSGAFRSVIDGMFSRTEPQGNNHQQQRDR